jgi:hypothetical protein
MPYIPALASSGTMGLAANNLPGSFDWNGLLGGLGFGMQMGSAVGNFNQSMQQHRSGLRNQMEGFEGSQANLRALLGIAAGGALGSPGNDFVGGMEDPRSRYMAQGTLVGGPSGGIDPRVMKTREMLYNLLQTQAIQPKDLAQIQSITSRGLGGQLEASSRAPTGSANQGLASLLDFGQAGTASANNEIQAALANRAFSRNVASQGMNFLSGLYGAAGSVV